MKPKFKIGQVVSYGNGSTALMRIESVSENHGDAGQHRYYGVQFYGGTVGAYEYDMREATPEQVERFENDDHIGRLRDYGTRLNPKAQAPKVELRDMQVVGFGGHTHEDRMVIDVSIRGMMTKEQFRAFKQAVLSTHRFTMEEQFEGGRFTVKLED